MAKSSQRLDSSALAEVLGQRGLVDLQRLNLALQTSSKGGLPFPEALVNENLIGDWELSRLVAEVYGLPFLPADMCSPAEEARAGLDLNFLREHRLIPLGRHGKLLTVIMPAMVQAEVLQQLARQHDVQILALVGTVNSSNRWLEQNMAADIVSTAEGDQQRAWSNIFDEGDAAVLMDLSTVTDTESADSLGAPGALADVDSPPAEAGEEN